MSGIEKEVSKLKSDQEHEQQRLEALRKRKTAKNERLAHYVEKERSELRKDSKLAKAGKSHDKD